MHGPEVIKPEDAATGVPVVGRGALLYPEHFPDSAGPEHPSAAVLCDVVARQRFEILDSEPALPAPPRRHRARQAQAGQLTARRADSLTTHTGVLVYVAREGYAHGRGRR